MTYPGETSRTTQTTASGTSYIDVIANLEASSVTSHVLIPATVSNLAPIVLLIAAHGSNGFASDINLDRFVATRDGCLDRGWVIISSDAHGNAWGNQTALNDYSRCYDWAEKIWSVTDVLLHGWSMGGLTMMTMAAKKLIPKVRATVSIDGAVNLSAMYNNTPYVTAIKAAYNIAADGSDYSFKTAGFDPSAIAPSYWSGQRLFLEASTGDATVSKVNNSDIFYPRVNPVADVTYLIGSGGHVDTSNFKPTDVLAFLDASLIPPPVESSIQIYKDTEWVSAAAYLNDGSEWQPVVLDASY